MAAPTQAFHRYLVTDARDYHLPALRIRRTVYRNQIAFEDTGVAH